VQARAGDEWTLFWVPARNPKGYRCFEHLGQIDKPPTDIRDEDVVAQAEANRHAGFWRASDDSDVGPARLTVSDCLVEVLEGPL
jgi:hypothetical protein